MVFQLSLGLIFAFFITLQVSSCTKRPIVGILAQELEGSEDTYIAASYVKAVEAAGARVVPIFIKKDMTYYREILYKLNGVVLPGGSSSIKTEGGFYDIANKIFGIALEMKSKGIRFPILGVCQGFEVLAVASNNMKADTLMKCNGMEGVMLPLEFTKGFKLNSLYENASDEIIFTLATRNITANYHKMCLRPETPLKYPWQILSTNLDGDNTPFVSSMQFGSFVGVQFHPEKNAYEWGKEHPSDLAAIRATRHFYDWLVNEARANNNRFSSVDEERGALIYNYNPEYSGKNGDSMFVQVYFFRSEDPEKQLYRVNDNRVQ